MDKTQTKIIELLREVHLIAIKEVERLNLRISELESERHQRVVEPKPKTVVSEKCRADHSTPGTGSNPDDERVSNRRGPKFIKIGSAVRYRKSDVDAWIKSCPTLS